MKMSQITVLKFKIPLKSDSLSHTSESAGLTLKTNYTMANSISLNAAKDELIFNDGNTTNIALSGNGANLSLVGGDINARAASSPASGDLLATYSVASNPNIDVGYNSGSQMVDFVGIEDMTMQRSFSVASEGINVQRDGDSISVRSL